MLLKATTSMEETLRFLTAAETERFPLSERSTEVRKTKPKDHGLREFLIPEFQS
jgi:hypothetical protein